MIITTKEDFDVLWLAKHQRATKLPAAIRVVKMNSRFVVQTLEGTMVGAKGDYLVEGTIGELYIIRAEVFEKSFKMVKQGRP